MSEQKDNLKSIGYMSKADVRTFIGGEFNPLSQSTIPLWIKTRNFPKPALYIGQRYPIWKKQDVLDWLKKQKESKTEQEAL